MCFGIRLFKCGNKSYLYINTLTLGPSGSISWQVPTSTRLFLCAFVSYLPIGDVLKKLQRFLFRVIYYTVSTCRTNMETIAELASDTFTQHKQSSLSYGLVISGRILNVMCGQDNPQWRPLNCGLTLNSPIVYIFVRQVQEHNVAK